MESIVAAMDSTTLKKELLQKSFEELDAHKGVTENCTIQWKELDEHFSYIDEALKKRFEELLEKEKEFEARASETWKVLEKRDGDVAVKEQASLSRVQEEKDAAVATIREACAEKQKEALLDSSAKSDGDGENKVNDSPVVMDIESNVPTSDKEEKSPKSDAPKLGTASEVKPRPQLKQVCEQMDPKGLLKLLTENRKSVTVLREEVPAGLRLSVDPARLVLNALEGFYPPNKGNKTEPGLASRRRSCILLLECLAPLLGSDHPEVASDIKEQAKMIADDWKSKLADVDIDASNGNSLEAQAFLQLLATFAKSLLKRLKKRSSRHEKEEDDDEGDEQVVTGNNAPVFSENLGGHESAQPHYIKTRTRHKNEKEFDKLFLAQELTNPISSENGEANLGNSAIWTMKFSKDGKFLATGGQDTVVRVWAVISSDEEREHFLEGSGTSVYEMSSGAKLRAPVFRDKPLYEYDGHTADVLDLSWSKNNFLLSSSMDKTVRLWHITRKECLCCFQHSDFVTAIAFHPKDDRFFLSGSLDCKLRLWNIPDKRVAHWNEITDQHLITAVGFTLDGKMAVAGSFSGLCQFYETVGLKYNTQIHVRSTRGRNATGKKITGIEAMPGTLPGHDKLLISSNDSRIRLYNMRDKSLELKYKGLENTCSQIRATFSDDGRYIISGSEDRHIYIFRTDQSNMNSSSGASGNGWLKKDKCGFESFEAHGATVTVSIFAPTRTRQLIGLCGDPIFAKTINHDVSVSSDKQTYPDGNIIVSADCTGSIKIFRQDCAYYSSHDADSRSVRSTRSFNSVLGNNLNNLFVKKKQSFGGGRPRRKSDASSILSFTSSILSADASVNENEEDAEQFQCECGSTEFKAFINKGKSKLVCANCHKVA